MTLKTNNQYKAFISYRKTSSVYADFVKSMLKDKGLYKTHELFLDRHDIGPEFFDTKIKFALEHSKCMILVVSQGCFMKKSEDDDWFIKEIKTAIKQNLKIIPVFFDGIKSLSQENIKEEMKSSFSEEEIRVLLRSQGVMYNDEYSDAAIDKLIEFVDKANRNKNALVKTIFFGVSLAVICFTVFFFLCFGLGCIVGYFASSKSVDSIIVDNTNRVDNMLIFEFGGWSARYNLDDDSIVMDSDGFNHKPKESNLDLIFSSCTFSGALTLCNISLSNVKYMRLFQKMGGSKQANLLKLGVMAGVCIGSFCGFSQGFKFGRYKRQDEYALAIYPKLSYPAVWEPAIRKYSPFRNFNMKKILKEDDNQQQKSLLFIMPIIDTPADTLVPAYSAGIKEMYVLIEYNSWNFKYDRDFSLLRSVMEKSKSTEKNIICLDYKTGNIIDVTLPSGFVGVQVDQKDVNDDFYNYVLHNYESRIENK